MEPLLTLRNYISQCARQHTVIPIYRPVSELLQLNLNGYGLRRRIYGDCSALENSRYGILCDIMEQQPRQAARWRYSAGLIRNLGSRHTRFFPCKTIYSRQRKCILLRLIQLNVQQKLLPDAGREIYSSVSRCSRRTPKRKPLLKSPHRKRSSAQELKWG